MLFAQWVPGQDARFPFSSESLDRIDIVIDQDSLDIILQDGNQLSDYEFPATFIYTYRNTDSQIVRIDTVEQIGFRLRGNTSRNSAKKSFKVSFNTFQSGRNTEVSSTTITRNKKPLQKRQKKRLMRLICGTIPL